MNLNDIEQLREEFAAELKDISGDITEGLADRIKRFKGTGTKTKGPNPRTVKPGVTRGNTSRPSPTAAGAEAAREKAAAEARQGTNTEERQQKVQKQAKSTFNSLDGNSLSRAGREFLKEPASTKRISDYSKSFMKSSKARIPIKTAIGALKMGGKSLDFLANKNIMDHVSQEVENRGGVMHSLVDLVQQPLKIVKRIENEFLILPKAQQLRKLKDLEKTQKAFFQKILGFNRHLVELNLEMDRYINYLKHLPSEQDHNSGEKYLKFSLFPFSVFKQYHQAFEHHIIDGVIKKTDKDGNSKFLFAPYHDATGLFLEYQLFVTKYMYARAILTFDETNQLINKDLQDKKNTHFRYLADVNENYRTQEEREIITDLLSRAKHDYMEKLNQYRKKPNEENIKALVGQKQKITGHEFSDHFVHDTGKLVISDYIKEVVDYCFEEDKKDSCFRLLYSVSKLIIDNYKNNNLGDGDLEKIPKGVEEFYKKHDLFSKIYQDIRKFDKEQELLSLKGEYSEIKTKFPELWKDAFKIFYRNIELQRAFYFEFKTHIFNINNKERLDTLYEIAESITKDEFQPIPSVQKIQEIIDEVVKKIKDLISKNFKEDVDLFSLYDTEKLVGGQKFTEIQKYACLWILEKKYQANVIMRSDITQKRIQSEKKMMQDHLTTGINEKIKEFINKVDSEKNADLSKKIPPYIETTSVFDVIKTLRKDDFKNSEFITKDIIKQLRESFTSSLTNENDDSIRDKLKETHKDKENLQDKMNARYNFLSKLDSNNKAENKKIEKDKNSLYSEEGFPIWVTKKDNSGNESDEIMILNFESLSKLLIKQMDENILYKNGKQDINTIFTHDIQRKIHKSSGVNSYKLVKDVIEKFYNIWKPNETLIVGSFLATNSFNMLLEKFLLIEKEVAKDNEDETETEKKPKNQNKPILLREANPFKDLFKIFEDSLAKFFRNHVREKKNVNGHALYPAHFSEDEIKKNRHQNLTSEFYNKRKVAPDTDANFYENYGGYENQGRFGSDHVQLKNTGQGPKISSQEHRDHIQEYINKSHDRLDHILTHHKEYGKTFFDVNDNTDGTHHHKDMLKVFGGERSFSAPTKGIAREHHIRLNEIIHLQEVRRQIVQEYDQQIQRFPIFDNIDLAKEIQRIEKEIGELDKSGETTEKGKGNTTTTSSKTSKEDSNQKFIELHNKYLGLVGKYKNTRSGDIGNQINDLVRELQGLAPGRMFDDRAEIDRQLDGGEKPKSSGQQNNSYQPEYGSNMVTLTELIENLDNNENLNKNSIQILQEGLPTITWRKNPITKQNKLVMTCKKDEYKKSVGRKFSFGGKETNEVRCMPKGSKPADKAAKDRKASIKRWRKIKASPDKMRKMKIRRNTTKKFSRKVR